ncbi:uncharacterized protein BXZ73DRAFT_3568, partial [Epithele typhae]|uniref:uncharacterized protein n=1 Tax=Epithele typhae TaxID=378194 RepID=UPI0020089C29
LQLLLQPGFEGYNRPTWVQRLESRIKPFREIRFGRYTTHMMFTAMFETAARMNLGDSAQEYLSTAIRTCVQTADGQPERDREMILAKELQKLATTWVGYMLWPFATAAVMNIMEPEEISEAATAPGSGTDTPTSSIISLPKNRVSSLRDHVLLRDRFMCFFSGAVDPTCPTAHRSRLQYKYKTKLNAAHIFKRAVATFHEGSTDAEASHSCLSLETTLTILKNYCRVERSMQLIIDTTDDPQNAILLSPETHSDFDAFAWCLKTTEAPHRYEICRMSGYEGRDPVQEYVTFEDHSAEFSASEQAAMSSVFSKSGTRKRGSSATGIDLPNPELLRMHCALTHVLHLSGAAGLFDALREPGNEDGSAGAGAAVAGTGDAFQKHVVDED